MHLRNITYFDVKLQSFIPSSSEGDVQFFGGALRIREIDSSQMKRDLNRQGFSPLA